LADPAAPPAQAGGAWYSRMVPRDPREPHRAATPLELLFDLCFVVAVAFAAADLHHALSEDHIADGVAAYPMVFFGIWWAWMNFTWFATAYDTDDVPYRVATLVQITGALILAAGVPRAFEEGDFGIVTLGYAVMRVALAAQWVRAGLGEDGPGRRTAFRYAGGITALMLGWTALLWAPDGIRVPLFLVLVLLELAVPLWAERGHRTSWHAGHIAERYGLFTIIVLGETILSATTAIQTALAEGEASAAVLLVAVAGAVIVFALWWLYFARSAHHFLTSNRVSFVWGYGHFVIFAAAAAVGAGLAVKVDYHTHHSALTAGRASAAVAIPVAVLLLSMWALHVRPHRTGRLHDLAYPAGAALVLLTPLTGALSLVLIAVVLAGLVAICTATGPARTG
jgi:low temperature requirement protein LtrA